MQDDFGDRMKAYEAVEAGRRLDVTLPICARIDGRRFSRFTKGRFHKPFDLDISRAMRETCAFLVEHTHPRIGYVQSDEISLVWQAEPGSSIFFDGRLQKMCSVLGSLATSWFSSMLSETNPTAVKEGRPVFDARVWQVPSREEAVNVLLWRAQDARRNGFLAIGHHYLSPKQMHGKSRTEVREMLDDLGVDFRKFAYTDLYGEFYQRVTREIPMGEDELVAIPERFRPTGPVLRSFVEPLGIGYFGDVKDRVGLVFGTAKETVDA
jgi:tRNA(His) guanylyltransferase